MSFDLDLPRPAFAGASPGSPTTVVPTERATRQQPSLRRFLLLQGLAQGADAAVTLTLAQVVVFSLERGATPATVVRALAMTAGPYLAALPVAGLVSDRWARHRTLAAAQLTRALIALAAIGVPLSRNATAGYIVLMAVMASAGLTNSVRSAALPHVVRPERLIEANSWSSITGKVAGTLSVGIALAVGRAHPLPTLMLAAIAHLVAGLRFASWNGDLGGGAPRSTAGGFHDIARRALSLVTADPLRRPVLTSLAQRALQGAAVMIFVILAETRLHLGASGYATALGATAVGTLLGSTVVPALLRRHDCEWLDHATWVASAVGLLLAAAFLSTITGVVALVVVGATFQSARLVADSAVQLAVVDDALGRVYSLYDSWYHVAMLAGALGAFMLPGQRSVASFLVLGGLFTAFGIFRHVCSTTQGATN